MSKVNVYVARGYVNPEEIWFNVEVANLDFGFFLSRKRALKLLNDLARVLDGE